MFSYADIAVLKALSRVQVDYVEFDCTEMTLAADSNEQLVALDKLSSASMAAAKLGIGVNCFGGIDYMHLQALASIPHLEDICMGVSLIKRAMLVGVDRAVQEAQQVIRAYQRA